MNAAADREFLGCRAGDIGIAIDVDSVQEVFETRMITRLPGCPKFVVGMINIRGSVIPVLDLFNVFDRRVAVKKTVVLKSDEGLVGLMISILDDLLRLGNVEKVDRAPAALTDIASSLDGKAVADGREFFVVNAPRMIASTLPQTAE